MRSITFILVLTTVVAITAGHTPLKQDDNMVSYIVDPQKQDLRFYWKNDSGDIFRSIQNLKDHLERKNKKLVFAMNGGMYKEDNAPLGLYIENFKTLSRLNLRSASGNFYLKPNGVFYITKDNKPAICQSEAFPKKTSVKFATQWSRR